MELRHLRYFTMLAEELHFGRAAARLGIAQPALSQQIRQLENELGVVLLERSKRRVRLTGAGEAFLEKARGALSQAEDAIAVARQVGRGEIGRLSVGFVTSALYGLFPDVIRSFRQRFPKVHLTLQELPVVEQPRALRSGRIQVSFLRPPLESEGLTVRTISMEPWLAALPAAHRYSRRSTIPLRWLAKDPFILFPRDLAASLYDQIISMCQRAGFSPNIVLEAQMHTIVSLVAAGIGAAVVPASLQNLRRHGVVYKPLQGTTPKVELAVAWRENDPSSVLQSFLAVLWETCGTVSSSRGRALARA